MKFVNLIFILLFASNVQAKVYNYEITRVIDADTIVFDAPFLPEPLGPTLSLRLYGVDAPGVKGYSECQKESEMGKDAKEYVESLINNSTEYKIVIKQWDKYGGRVNGDIIIDGESLRAKLLNMGIVRIYYGDRKKKSWCE